MGDRRMRDRSLSSRRAWIEMADIPLDLCSPSRRSPHGERGLKFQILKGESLLISRSPHGERGLKFFGFWVTALIACRSPHGERGLKY